MKSHTFPIILTLAFFLDLLMGDPPFLPHPVRIIGKGIGILESLLRKIVSVRIQERLAGILLAVMIILTTFLCAYLTEKWILFGTQGILKIVGIFFLVYLTATTLATKELLRAGLHVIKAIEAANIDLARRHLSMIVGRDVNTLDQKGILKAVIETVSENLSDGVIAPLFYLTLGGMPLGFAYKAVNTLDSMVGYKNERYLYFGWASARIDDLANFIPARISGILIALSAGLFYSSRHSMAASFRTMLRDGKNHSSPNSGYPEAAMAGALGVRLGGPAVYFGTTVDKPYIGSEVETDYLAASIAALKIVRLASFCGFIISMVILVVLGFL